MLSSLRVQIAGCILVIVSYGTKINVLYWANIQNLLFSETADWIRKFIKTRVSLEYSRSVLQILLFKSKLFHYLTS